MAILETSSPCTHFNEKSNYSIYFHYYLSDFWGSVHLFGEAPWAVKFGKENLHLDLPGMRRRGFIIAAVDNNTAGYYIYRVEGCGYEYELLFAKATECQLRLSWFQILILHFNLPSRPGVKSIWIAPMNLGGKSWFRGCLAASFLFLQEKWKCWWVQRTLRRFKAWEDFATRYNLREIKGLLMLLSCQKVKDSLSAWDHHPTCCWTGKGGTHRSGRGWKKSNGRVADQKILP